MALDTTVGGASSDSYVDASTYEAYIVANIDLNFNGVGQTSKHEMNLRRAAQWLDRKYKFVGMQQYQTQSRAWPRLTDVLVDGWPIDPDTVPQDIKDAQCELAYLFEEKSIDPTTTIEGVVKVARSKAGPVETETEYQGGKSTPRLVAVEGLLQPYLAAGSGQVGLHRS
jgi:hypothetical protein